MSFGVDLRALRSAAGLTQEELAARAGLTANGVSALERGTRTRPYPHTVRALADALGLDGNRREQFLSASREGSEAPPHGRDGAERARSRVDASLRVVVADDNFLVREGVAALLAESEDVEVLGLAGDPDALFEAVVTQQPNAVLTDIRMPPTFTTEGIDAARRIRATYPTVGVVVLSQYVEADYAFELLQDGVAGLGYLLKERVADLDQLVRALQDVVNGGSALDPKVVEGLMARKAKESWSPLASLTDREREVLEAMATGRNNAAIARTLYMSERAVEKHVGAVFHKLGLTEDEDVSRRVMAVLAFLDATTPPS
jgi:DNA-binding NarL/FixJ family response regulator/DNA-binding XRE family transcriptional regulator